MHRRPNFMEIDSTPRTARHGGWRHEPPVRGVGSGGAARRRGEEGRVTGANLRRVREVSHGRSGRYADASRFTQAPFFGGQAAPEPCLTGIRAYIRAYDLATPGLSAPKPLNQPRVPTLNLTELSGFVELDITVGVDGVVRDGLVKNSRGGQRVEAASQSPGRRCPCHPWTRAPFRPLDDDVLDAPWTRAPFRPLDDDVLDALDEGAFLSPGRRRS